MKIYFGHNLDNEYKIVINIPEKDFVRAKPSKFEAEALRVYKKTKKSSDYLFYLSELVKNIEETENL